MALIEGQDWGWRLDRRVADTTLRQVFQSLQRYLSNKDEEVTYDIQDLNNAVAAAKQAAQDANTAANTALGAAQDALDAANDASGDASTALSAAEAAQTAATNAEATAQAASDAAADALLAAAGAEASATAAEATATTALAAAQDAEDAAADAFDAATSASAAAAAAATAAADAQAAAAQAQAAAAQAQAAADAAQATADGAQSTADDAIAGLGTLQDEVDGILPITETKIAPDAVTAPKIAANAVVAGKIAANAVTADAMAAMNIGVGKHIRSTTYDPGVDGWSIDADGSAEFNDVTVRGTITGSEITGSTITGGRFQTAETGPRVVVDAGESSGIRWPSDEAGEITPAEVVVDSGGPLGGAGLEVRGPRFHEGMDEGIPSTLRVGYEGTWPTGQYFAGLAGDEVNLAGQYLKLAAVDLGGARTEIDLQVHGAASNSGLRIDEDGMHAITDDGDMSLSALGGEIVASGETIRLDADTVLVNGVPIGTPEPPLVLSNSSNRQFNVANNTWTLFPPFGGSNTVDSESPSVHEESIFGFARFDEGLYEISGVFGLRTHGGQTSTLVLQWYNVTTDVVSRQILTFPMRPTSAQDSRIPFGPVAFRVTNSADNFSFRGRHVSDDSTSHYMWLDELTAKRIGD